VKPEHVAEAKDEYHKLHEAYLALRNPESDRTAKMCWQDILLRTARIYEKLGKGKFGKSQQWWNEKAKERKSDDLLSYVQHARNADNHGVVLLGVPLHALTLMARDNGGGWIRSFSVDTDGLVSVDARDERGTPIAPQEMVALNRLALVAVKDRDDIYEPPTTHLGHAIVADNIVSVAALLVRYMSNMIEEADSLSRE
jgi:hypothetical protein